MTVVLSANQGDQAYIDRVDASGFTALHWAVISHHFAFAKMLLEAGARVDIEDAKGKTAKAWAEERGKGDKWRAMVKLVGQEDITSLPFPKVLFRLLLFDQHNVEKNAANHICTSILHPSECNVYPDAL